MANLSNNKPHASLRGGGLNKSKSHLWLLLLLFTLCCNAASAQNAYNRLYTLQAHASTFEAIAPHGSLGGCMAAATVVDSSTGQQAIRIARFDAMGNLQASNYFNIPDDTARTIYVNYKAITRVHDNCYAMVGTVLPSSKQYAFILLADSNGSVYKYKDLISRDTFFDYISDVKYDGYGHIIACGHYFTNNKVSDSSYGVIYKFDTALNRIWLKQYHPSDVLITPGFFSLIVDSSGYTLGGGSQNSGLNSFKGYKCQSLIVKTDTAGTLQWTWSSPTAAYTDYQSFISAALHTLDGGYLFTTEGHTYNRYPSSAPVIQLEGKQLIIKMDAARNKQWEVVVDDYYDAFGISRTHLIELSDSSFIYAGYRITDSLGPISKEGSPVLQHYSKDGKLLKQRIVHQPPKEPGDTTVNGGPYYDIKQMPDKSFILCGYYQNETVGVSPAQRAWLLKLDSNLCLGAGDSQCIPSSITELPGLAEAGFSIYPNPSSGNLTIASLRGSKQSESITAKVYDILGRVVHQSPLNFSNNTATLQFQITSGMYIFELRSKDGVVQRERVVVE